ncbi:ABC-type spermidine/putrescine transport system, ATPase component [Jonquetella anthropi DSM 22815]|uniref:ABC-type spermidine/putrescine transport system, ATPase component n=1 Tax=Jonquetella anthropi DSM 22815 TaxID=885272 RepID=H0UJL7_9BACT|nr:ABC transporter ATP-binding protein [Jonquetella anthropi]EEX48871.1 ABC transporter, ATP-binding protein [Jonquetella anthropi E3_33 E1]EHM12885.1 ABC-type spermidine/putrescine transport system, ATPase component [Jonquetella anthropi DSM 22815]
MALSLKLSELSKTYTKDGQKFAAVDGVNLEVGQGEFLTFLGPSGCGKTTTLRMIAGFETPSSGKIVIGGSDVTDLPPNQRNVGFVFQNYALFPHMTVFDNVAYGLRVRGQNAGTIAQAVTGALELVGLPAAAKRYPSQLSGGEQQRVALARVLVLKPQVLLMDEPLSNLDAKLRLHMRTEIRRIQQELSLTCLYVTHDQKEALTMSDRIMVMNRGHVEQLGSPMDLYADPASLFVADFIGQANLLKGRLAQINGEFGTVDLGNSVGRAVARLVRGRQMQEGQSVVLVVRPENISLEGDESDGSLSFRVDRRLFEGDRINYSGCLGDGRPVDSSVPFLVGTRLIEPGEMVRASFDRRGAVVVPDEK